MTSPRSVLVFIHQPKAGGVALGHVIRRQFDPKTVFEIQGDSPKTVQKSVRDLRALSIHEKLSIRCLMGHVPFGIHAFIPRPCSYITILRNPIDRVLSHFSYVRDYMQEAVRSDTVESTDPYLQEQSKVFCEKPRLETYLEWQRRVGMNNLQTRCLISPAPGDWERLDRAYPALDLEKLALAMQNLEHNFLVAGTQERYAETVLLLKHRLGWRNVYYWRDNVTRNRLSAGDLSDDLLATIRNDNAYDYELWSFANRLLDRERVAGNVEFSHELRAFKSRNRLVGPVLRTVDLARKKVRIRSRLRLLFDGS